MKSTSGPDTSFGKFCEKLSTFLEINTPPLAGPLLDDDGSDGRHLPPFRPIS